MPRERIFSGYDVVDNAHFRRGADAARQDADGTRARLKLPEHYFLASNRFIEKKNLVRLVRAFAAYRRSAGPKAWDLVLLGDGPLRDSLERLVRELDIHERVLMPVPGRLDWPQAGGVPEVFTTAHDALFSQAGLRTGERLLVHGAAGGVGSAAVQLGRAAGARVSGTVRNPELREGVAALGASVLAPEEFVDQGPFDVILELVGGPNMSENLLALSTGGRISVIGVAAGAKSELNLLALMGKRARIHGSTLRGRPFEEKAIAIRHVEREVLPLFESARLSVPVAETFPLADAAVAYDRFAAGGKLGKIVITL